MICAICAIISAIFKRNVDVFGILGLFEITLIDWWLIPLIIVKI